MLPTIYECLKIEMLVPSTTAVNEYRLENNNTETYNERVYREIAVQKNL